MRQIYAERLEVLCDAANQRLGGMLQVQKAASGMRTIALLKTGEKDIAVAERARARGLELTASHSFHSATLTPELWILALRAVLRLSYAVESKFWRRFWALGADGFRESASESRARDCPPSWPQPAGSRVDDLTAVRNDPIGRKNALSEVAFG